MELTDAIGMSTYQKTFTFCKHLKRSFLTGRSALLVYIKDSPKWTEPSMRRELTWGARPVSAVIANLYMEIFEEQAIESAPCKPKIWKRYVDDTFTILDRDKVDDFLQQLNSQQPSICFTMETENNSKITFLDTSVCENQTAALPPATSGSQLKLINT